MTLLAVEKLAIDVDRDGSTHRLVHDASFSVDRGETLAIVGESGSGKSLSALAVIGLLSEGLRVASGAIRFAGQDITALDEPARNDLRGSEISMIFQEPMTSLNPVRSIGHQITEGMRLKLGLTRRQARARALELLEEVGISDPQQRLKQYPHQLSGGMRQRVMIAIALACKPSLILADEPTTALDVTIQAQILKLLRKLCRETGTAMILVTHDLGVIAQTADRIAVMYAGQIVETAATGPLFDAPGHPYTRALMRSMPARGKRQEKLQSIPGTVPSPHRMPAACRFAPRCELRREAGLTRCTQEAPPLIGLPGGGAARCWALETRKEPA